MKVSAHLLILFLFAGNLACSTSEPLPIITSISSPAAGGSGEPNLMVGADGNLYFCWIEEDGDGHVLKFSIWEGENWSSPTVVAQGSNWFVNWADFPSLTALEDGTLFAHWLAMNGEGTYAYGVNVSTSQDGGKTWSAPFIPHRDQTETEHGFVSMIPMGDRMGLFWLDGREMAGAGHGNGHGGDPEAAMTLRYAALDKENRLSDETVLDSKICDCCSTDAIRLSDGSMVVVYRDRSDEEIRDISTVRWENGNWTPPRSVHADLWKINGCPVNGPEMAFRGDRLAVAWFTLDQDNQSHVRLAFSSDGGNEFEPPIRVDDGNPLGRVDLVFLEDESVLVSWMEDGQDGNADVRIRKVTVDGESKSSTVVATTRSLRGSGFPRMVLHQDQVFFAWTDYGDPSQVKTAVYR